MRINSINTYTPKVNFSGVNSMNKKIPQALFGDKEGVFDALSDIKGVDIWVVDMPKGGMFNRQTAFHVIVRKSDGCELIKEMNCNDVKDERDTLNYRLKETLIWLDAPTNLTAMNLLSHSKAAQLNPKYTKEVSDDLLKSSMSREAGVWKSKIGLI